MKRWSFYARLTLVLIAALALNSCGPLPEEETAVVMQPTSQLPEIVTTVDVSQFTPPSYPWLGLLCPEAGPLPEDDPDYQVRFDEPYKEGEFWYQQGLYTNKDGQPFNYTVKGLNETALREYTDNLRICMELLPIAEMEYETDVSDESSLDVYSEDEVFKESRDALVIYSNPADENKEIFEDGYIWVFLIDPGIGNGVTHDYARYCRDGARTTVTVSAAGGSVRATHYRKPPGGLYFASIRDVLAGRQTSWYYIGRATYDLAVRGTAPGTTRYSVSGTIWNFGFYSLPPNGGGTPCQ